MTHKIPPNDATGSLIGGISLTNDLGGTATSVNVVGLQGNSVSSASPSTSDLLTWTGSTWEPKRNSKFTNALFVDAGSTNTTEDGSNHAPYKTIGASLSAANPNTAIFISPGTYTENINIPNKDNLALIGYDSATTIIQSSTGTTINWTGSALTPISNFYLKNLKIINTFSGGNALAINGTARNVLALLSPMFSGLFSMVDCILEKTGTGDCINFNCLGLMIMVNVNIVSGNVNITNVSYLNSSLCVFKDVVLTYNRTLSAPQTGRSGYYFTNAAQISNLTINGHPILAFGPDAQVSGTTTGTLTASLGSGQDYAPILIFQGTYGSPLIPGSGNMTLTLPDPVSGVSARNYVNLSKGEFYGNVTLSKNSSTNGRASIFGYNSTFFRVSPLFLTTVTIGANADGYFTTSQFTQAGLAASGSGAIDRDFHLITGQTSSTSNATINFTPPFPAGTSYTIVVEPVSATNADLIVATSNKTTSSFDWISNIAGRTVNIRLQRN